MLSECKEQEPVNNLMPTVHSGMIFKLCQSLDIKAQLAPEEERNIWIPKHKKSTESKPTVPVVKSEIIYQMCNALDIKVILSPTVEKDIVVLEPNREAKKNKPSPLVGQL
ncbi:hypothetical protein TNCV_4198891 [Trichonephila clavipes]|nr:hypothetical protein TNCV_4198891 [Trichonephila clavipes]